MSNYFTRLVDGVDRRLDVALVDGIEGVVSNVNSNGLFQVLITLGVIVYGYRLMMGARESVETAFRKFLVITLVYTLIFFPSLILQFFYEAIPGIGEEMANAIFLAASDGQQIASGPSEVYELLDETMALSIGAGNAMMEVGGWTSPVPVIWGVAVMVLGFLVVGYSAFLIIMSKVLLAVMALISPLAVASLLFESTKQIFIRWVSVVVQASLIPLLTFTICGLLMGLVKIRAGLAATTIEELEGFYATGSFLFVGIVVLALLWQVNTMASGLASGVMLGSMGVMGKAAALGLGTAFFGGRALGAGVQHGARGLKKGADLAKKTYTAASGAGAARALTRRVTGGGGGGS